MTGKRNQRSPHPVHSEARPASDVQLNRTNNPWKPSRFLASSLELNEEDLRRQIVVKKVTGLLNKITPENFYVICQQLSQLSMDANDLYQLMSILYEKATSEHTYCRIYVQLANFLNTIPIANLHVANESANFTSLLITKCLQEFDKEIYVDVDIEARNNCIKNCIDLKMKLQLLDELDWHKQKARKKAMGNMKLIGELYTADIIDISVINSCVQKLLSLLDEDNIERLCTLIRIIGPKFAYELEQISPYNSTFEQEIVEPLSRVANNDLAHQLGPVSSRIRFMALDVLEMSRNDWREREVFKQNQPRTLGEIRSEFLQVEE